MTRCLIVFLIAFVGSNSANAQSTSNSNLPAAKATATAKSVWAAIVVSDLDSSSKWYQDNLGYKITKKMDLPEHKLRIVFLQLNGFTLELIEFQESVAFDAVKKKVPELKDHDHLQGIVKLGFQISDVNALASALKARGVKLRMEPTDDPEFHDRFFLVVDPDGNTLQFFQELHPSTDSR